MEFMKVIKNRRSVRKFKSDQISEEVLHNILQAGRYAPSGGHAENYYFGVIKDQEKRSTNFFGSCKFWFKCLLGRLS